MFEGDAASVRKAHRDLLEAMRRDHPVLRRRRRRVEARDGERASGRSVAVGAARHCADRYTCVAGESTPDKQELIDMEEDGLIVALEGVADAALADSVKNAFEGRRPPPRETA